MCGTSVTYHCNGGISSKKYYQGGSLKEVRRNSYSGPNNCGNADGHDAYYSGWDNGTSVTAPACQGGGNQQSVCESKCATAGCRYECLWSETIPASSDPSETIYADGGGCEITTFTGCNDQAGYATVLMCSR
jgi:hypothetical protein